MDRPQRFNNVADVVAHIASFLIAFDVVPQKDSVAATGALENPALRSSVALIENSALVGALSGLNAMRLVDSKWCAAVQDGRLSLHRHLALRLGPWCRQSATHRLRKIARENPIDFTHLPSNEGVVEAVLDLVDVIDSSSIRQYHQEALQSPWFQEHQGDDLTMFSLFGMGFVLRCRPVVTFPGETVNLLLSTRPGINHVEPTVPNLIQVMNDVHNALRVHGDPPPFAGLGEMLPCFMLEREVQSLADHLHGSAEVPVGLMILFIERVLAIAQYMQLAMDAHESDVDLESPNPVLVEERWFRFMFQSIFDKESLVRYAGGYRWSDGSGKIDAAAFYRYLQTVL